MKWAVASWVLTGFAVLGGTAGMAHARPPQMHGYVFNSGSYPVHRVAHPGGQAPRPRRDAGTDNAKRERDDASRNAQPQRPEMDPRRNGHMSPEDRRLLRQHIEDAVKELYTR